MKFCIPYYSSFRYFDVIDEIILQYSEHNENIVEFVISHYNENQRVIVDITSKLLESNINNMIPILKKLQQEHKNMVVKTNSKTYKELREGALQYFFTDFCRTDDEVYAFIKQGVSDVYIVENLAFNLREMGEYCHKKHVNVRVIPNMAQYAKGQKEWIPAPCKFFIRPEDIDKYEPYVDVFEFVAPGDRLSVLFKIYKSKQWLGDLDKLIIGLGEEFLNNGLIPNFGIERTKCKHRCMREQCFLCIDMQRVAKQFDNSGVEIKRKRDKEWMKDESEVNKEISESIKETATTNVNEVSEE